MRLDGSKKRIKLDAKDKKILELLVKNGRIAFTEIARKVMLSKDAVSYRIKRLQEQDVIKKFTVIIDYKKFGYSAYNLFLQTREVTEEKENSFLKYLDKEPRIIDVIDYSDIIDFQLKILTKNIEELNKIIIWIKKEFSDIIENITILPVMEEIYNLLLPREFIKSEHEFKSKKKEMKIDEKDIKIIKLLNENCRLSSYEIAEKINLNADTVIYRIRNMLSAGIIKFTTIINLSALGYEGYALLLKLRTMSIEEENKIRNFLHNDKNLIIAEKCVGEWDLLLHFVTKDAREFHTLIKKIRKELGDFILTYDTLMTYREYEFDYASFLTYPW